MGDNGVVLFISKHLDTEYCFYEDYMTVNGTPLRYSEMVDIDEIEGDSPSFVFTYGGRRFDLPYDPRYKEQIRPFFVKAALIEPQFDVDPDPVEFVEEPEEEFVEEEPAEEFVEEPEEEFVEEEFVEESEEEVTASEVREEPRGRKYAGVTDKLKGIPKKTLLIIAAVAAALAICIVLIVVTGGKSIDGLEENVRIETVETDRGDEYKMTVIDDDADVEDYALSYYKKCFKEGDKYHWIINSSRGETIMMLEQGDQVLICSFEHVEGEEEDESLLGSGDMKETWIMYPDRDQIIKV